MYVQFCGVVNNVKRARTDPLHSSQLKIAIVTCVLYFLKVLDAITITTGKKTTNLACTERWYVITPQASRI